MAVDLEICSLQRADLDELIALHSRYLNYGYGIRSHFQTVLDNPETVAVKGVRAGRIIGIDIYTRGVALSGGHPELCRKVSEAAGGATVYTGDALLVVPEFRRQGVDEAMLRACLKELKLRGAEYLLYELWVHPDGKTPAHRTVERFAQRTDLGLYPDFYVDFDHYGYFCPICGEKCRCSAHLYLCRIL